MLSSLPLTVSILAALRHCAALYIVLYHVASSMTRPPQLWSIYSVVSASTLTTPLRKSYRSMKRLLRGESTHSAGDHGERGNDAGPDASSSAAGNRPRPPPLRSSFGAPDRPLHPGSVAVRPAPPHDRRGG